MLNILTVTEDDKRIPTTFETMIDDSIILYIDLGIVKYEMFIGMEHIPRSTFERFLESLKKGESFAIGFEPGSNQDTYWECRKDGTVEISTYGAGGAHPTNTKFTIPGVIFRSALEKFLSSG